MKTKLLFLFLIISKLSFGQFDDKFYQPSKTMKPVENLDFSEFRIPVENDTISGIFIQQAKNFKKPKATILFFHGTAGNVTTYTFMTKPLAEAGYQVLMVDFRGYGKSTGSPSHQNIEKDGQNFFDYAVNLPEVKNTSIIIYGASMGSQIATHLAKNNQNSIKALVLDGSLSSFNDIAIHFTPQAESFLKNIPFPYSAKEDIKTITVPKLLIHSDGDKTVPIEEGKLVYENAQSPKFLLKYEGDHLEALVKDKENVLKQIDVLLK